MIRNLMDKEFDANAKHWSRRAAADMNDQCVEPARLKGDFMWHGRAHDDECHVSNFEPAQPRHTSEVIVEGTEPAAQLRAHPQSENLHTSGA